MVSINKTNTLGIIPNGIKVTLRNGHEYKFVISNREEVIKFLNSQVQNDSQRT